MKLFYKISIIVFNLCLLFSAIIIPALSMASSKNYYYSQFEKNGIYEKDGKRQTIYFVGGEYRNKAEFSDEQLNEIVDHIVDFLFGDTDSFELSLDGVIINGVETDNVRIFGDAAVKHMVDVKVLMRTALIGAILGCIICSALLILFIIKRKEVAPYILKYTLIFYVILFSLIALFCIWTLIGSSGYGFLDTMWTNAHHLLFPFQPEKFEGSFFNDTLTEILTLELFVTAVAVVMITLILSLAAWFVGVFLIKRSGTAVFSHNRK